MRDWMIKLIADEQDERGDLPPPWARFPGYTRTTIGWRMGYGESYKWAHHDWLEAQGWDREQRLAYLRRHPPAPRTWANAVSVMLSAQADTAEDELAALGLVADDVGAANWAARHGGHYRPWEGRLDLEGLARYGGRDLACFCRWAAELRARGELEAWLAEAPPSEAWAELGQALRGDTEPAARVPPEQGWRRVALEWAARADAPPPWTLGLPVPKGDMRYEADAAYPEAWVSVLETAIDDRATWRAALARWPAPPRRWQALLRRWSTFGYA